MQVPLIAATKGLPQVSSLRKICDRRREPSNSSLAAASGSFSRCA
jgi:hypothetical protein